MARALCRVCRGKASSMPAARLRPLKVQPAPASASFTSYVQRNLTSSSTLGTCSKKWASEVASCILDRRCAAVHGAPLTPRYTRYNLQCRLGWRIESARWMTQGSEAADIDNSSENAVKSFEDDCKAVEECNDLINARLDIEALESRLAELDAMVADPKLYDDSSKANQIVTERSKVDSKVQTVRRLTSELEQWKEMHEMAIAEGEGNMLAECVEKVALLRREAENARAETLLALGGDNSSSNCFLELQAGAGGTESHDWTQMLLKMYTRWAEKRNFTVKTLNLSSGDEAGLRGATILLVGDSAYGWLRTEAGVHRLVRNSPFDPGQRRHTSFAQVRIFPEAEALGGRGAAAIEIPTKDLRIDTMRAQGAGGQHVNTTDSAVRITHLPTGLVAANQSDRSQHRNKETAMRVLRAKLYQKEEDARRTKRNQYAQGLGDNAFGNQIRSYVMSPYQMVKDHRTNHQHGDVYAVLDGELEGFIEASLVAEHREGSEQESSEKQNN